MAAKRILSPEVVDHVPEITPEALKSHLGQVTLIDVRRPDEFTGELSHIPGAKLVTLGPELDAFLGSHDKTDEIVFICRSGGRSGQAARQSLARGFSKISSLRGGMLLWTKMKYPVEGASKWI